MDGFFYWIAGLAVSAFAGGVWLLWKDGKNEQERRLKADIDRLTVGNAKQKDINDAQATPFPNAAAANSWLQKQRNGHQ